MTRPESRPYNAGSANDSTDAAFNELRASIEEALARNEAALKRYRVEHVDGNVSYIYSKSIADHREHTPPQRFDWSGVIIASVLLASCIAYTVWRVL